MEKEQYKQFLLNFFNLDKVNNLLNEMDKEPSHALRLNPLKMVNFKELNSLENHPFIKNAYYYNKETFNAGKHPLHYAGVYYIQDASAMMVGHLLNVSKDDFVIDLCAAPGGKSTFVGPLLTDGLLVCNDISNSRCLDLIDNIERFGLDNTIVLNDEIKNITNSLEGVFDKVILDAPCSGEGMFRKNSLVNDDWSIEKVNRLSALQKELILDAYRLLKKDGIMVYSTCTFNKYENEDTINYLLENTNASLIKIDELEGVDRGINMPEAIRLFPDNFKGEGHFICLIKCNDDHYTKVSQKASNISNSAYKLWKEFEEKNLTEKLDKNRLFEYNNNIYYLPKHCIDIKNVHIMRQGILLGSIEKNVFKLSHNSSIIVSIKFKNSLNLSSDSLQINLYLHGDSFKADCENGYVQVCCDGIPLGLGKVSNGMLKNLYPKKLRKLGV